MNGDGKLVTRDLQASQPEVQLGLSRAGVQGVAKAIHLRWGRWDMYMLKWPIFGMLLEKNTMARTMRTLGTLVASGAVDE